MARYRQQLNEWYQQGLITAEQVERIQHYETEKAPTNPILRAFIFIGVFAISIGLISLIAANWYLTPPTIKLAGDFILMVSLAAFALYYYQHPSTLRYEALLLGFVFCVMASIALISQIFHTRGELYQAILLWSMLTLPLMLTARHSLVPLIWVGLTTPAVIKAIQPWKFAFFGPSDNQLYIFVLSLMLATLVLASLQQCLSRYWFSEKLARACRFWLPVYGVLSVFAADSLISIDTKLMDSFNSVSLPYLISYAGITLLCVFGIIREPAMSANRQKILLLLLLCYSSLAILIGLNCHSQVLGAMSSFIMLSLAAIYYSKSEHQRLFNIITLLIAFRIFVIYLQVIQTLAMTGIGLIISGIMLIVIALAWTKYIHQVQVWLKRSI